MLWWNNSHKMSRVYDFFIGSKSLTSQETNEAFWCSGVCVQFLTSVRIICRKFATISYDSAELSYWIRISLNELVSMSLRVKVWPTLICLLFIFLFMVVHAFGSTFSGATKKARWRILLVYAKKAFAKSHVCVGEIKNAKFMQKMKYLVIHVHIRGSTWTCLSHARKRVS